MRATTVEACRITITSTRLVEVKWKGITAQRSLAVTSLRRRTIDVMIGLLRSNRLQEVNELTVLGELLFDTLFGANADSAEDEYTPRSVLGAAIKGDSTAGAGRRLLNVTLEMGAGSELFASWPWEYLYVPEIQNDSDTGFFVGERANFVLTRHVPLVNEPRGIKVQPPLRVLFAVMTPTDLHPIEYETVLETLSGMRMKATETRIDLRVFAQEHRPDGKRYDNEDDSDESRTTYRLFLDSVDKFDPHVIHILAHGRYYGSEGSSPSGQMAFTRTDSTANWIRDQDLANQLMDSSSLRLVFLQACESAATSSNPYQTISGLAQWLAQRNIPAVIAMHFRVNSGLANEFASAFYESLVDRAAIEVAMHAARHQLYTSSVEGDSGREGFGLPVLYLRGSGALLSPLETLATTTEVTDSRSVSEAIDYPSPDRASDQGMPRPRQMSTAENDLGRGIERDVSGDP